MQKKQNSTNETKTSKNKTKSPPQSKEYTEKVAMDLALVSLTQLLLAFASFKHLESGTCLPKNLQKYITICSLALTYFFCGSEETFKAGRYPLTSLEILQYFQNHHEYKHQHLMKLFLMFLISHSICLTME